MSDFTGRQCLRGDLNFVSPNYFLCGGWSADEKASKEKIIFILTIHALMDETESGPLGSLFVTQYPPGIAEPSISCRNLQAAIPRTFTLFGPLRSSPFVSVGLYLKNRALLARLDRLDHTPVSKCDVTVVTSALARQQGPLYLKNRVIPGPSWYCLPSNPMESQTRH